MNNKNYWLYVLKLEQDKWYVGITTKTPEERYYEHTHNIRSAAWTRKYKPVELSDFIKLGHITKEAAERRESNATLEYMRKYGINNVRGGKYNESEEYVIAWGGRFYRKDVWETLKMGIVGIAMMYAFFVLILIARYF